MAVGTTTYTDPVFKTEAVELTMTGVTDTYVSTLSDPIGCVCTPATAGSAISGTTSYIHYTLSGRTFTFTMPSGFVAGNKVFALIVGRP